MVTLGFVHAGVDTSLPQIMVASVRRAMSGARIVQLTDRDTPAVSGVDEIARLDYDGTNLMPFRLRHLALLEPCDAIFVDTDVIVQRDLATVFEMAFDVALTRREDIGTDPNGVDVARVMPYNTGVMFGRASGWDFWHNAWQLCERYPEDLRRWWGDQHAIKAMAEIAPLRLLELPCASYNYAPGTEAEDVAARYVVHYKGKRKGWMKRRGQREFGMVL